jgi:hypothetical protein
MECVTKITILVIRFLLEISLDRHYVLKSLDVVVGTL